MWKWQFSLNKCLKIAHFTRWKLSLTNVAVAKQFFQILGNKLWNCVLHGPIQLLRGYKCWKREKLFLCPTLFLLRWVTKPDITKRKNTIFFLANIFIYLCLRPPPPAPKGHKNTLKSPNTKKNAKVCQKLAWLLFIISALWWEAHLNCTVV